jgi:hypothetical protein
MKWLFSSSWTQLQVLTVLAIKATYMTSISVDVLTIYSGRWETFDSPSGGRTGEDEGASSSPTLPLM